MENSYSHLVHIQSRDELRLYELIPNVVWIFDLDRHGWWWGNQAAIDFWGLKTVDDLINKDLSGDTQGAKDRTAQTFELAARQGLTIDPWTTYPNGKPKTLHMMHRAVLLGPQKHRGIIAYINEEVNLGETPENLLLVEAMRYTNVLVTSFTFDGAMVIENPAATEAYKQINTAALRDGITEFTARFADPAEGARCLEKAIAEQGGRWTHRMQTSAGLRDHTLDIRLTRHPLSGDFLILMSEYDVTSLHKALQDARDAQEKLQQMAYYEALTGLPTLHLFQDLAAAHIAHAQRKQEKLAVMFIDLDGFKTVNDTYGHEIGDQVLKEVAQRLKSSLRVSDLLARSGGDEFVALQLDIRSKQDALSFAEKMTSILARPVATHQGNIPIGASIGVALFPDHGHDLKTLINAADKAMYQVKRNGKNGVSMAQ
ncbi:MAG: GGDEF domain-containing protein [Thalassobium sp.]|nr:MAG: GGDEF domain-containing protein [Thalassobium sp.]